MWMLSGSLRMCKKSLLLLKLFSCFSVLAMQSAIVSANTALLPEITPIPLTLSGPLTKNTSEISGLTWCGDHLYLVPQYTDFYQANQHFIYRLSKSDINAHLEAILSEQSTNPLQPKPIVVNNAQLLEEIPGYDGLEAMVCANDQVFLAIELDRAGKREATVIARAVWQRQGVDEQLTIERISATLPSFHRINNMANESLLLMGETLLSLSEVNRAGRGQAVEAHRLALDLTVLANTEFVEIPYRITDATELDDNNRFWVANYLYRGDSHLRVKEDRFASRFGVGASHKGSDVVERLIELQWLFDKVTITDTPPIYLKLTPGTGRNWEGLVRLSDQGFLAATDKFPHTLLVFIPVP